MIRHARLSGRRDSGVTLMELLVTIVIATIFFAAAVPVFVGAIKAGSLDRMRVVAVNAAQDRIELIHNLDYDLITPSYLGSQLRTTWTAQSSAGPRQLTVIYGVTTSAASGTSSGYKVVTLTVTWTGNPQPVSPIVLNTIVYGQYGGPQISNFTVTPFDTTNDYLSPGGTTLTATINSADRASMQTITIGGQPASGYVTFAISSNSGTVYPSQTVYYNTSSPATYTSTWTTAPAFNGLADGVYTFSATAYNSSGSQGNTWTIRKRIESGPPAPVTNLAAVGTQGVAGVVLTWTPSVTGDVVKYVLTRLGGTSESFTPVTLPATATGYTDPSATATGSYTYTVTAVDWTLLDTTLHTTPAQKGVSRAAALPAPNPATNLVASQTDATITLTWSAPASAPYAIGGYCVYASGGTTPIATVNTTSTTITASQLSGMTWGGTYWFQVKPFLQATGQVPTGWATLASGQAATFDSGTGVNWAQAVLGSPSAQTPYTITVTADFTPQNTNDTASITLIYLGSSESASGTTIDTRTGIAANSAASWTSLAAGWYRISYVTQRRSGYTDVYVTGSSYTQTFNMI